MTKKPTSLQINKFYYLKGGSERYLFDLSKILTEAGHRVVAFSMADDKNQPSPDREYFIKYMNLHSFNVKNILKIFYNWEAARRLEKLIIKEKPDIAHLHNINYQLSPAVIRVLKRRQIPVIMTLHDYNPICPNAKLFTKGRPCQRCRTGRYFHCFLNKCSHNSYGHSFLAMLEAYFNNRWLKVYNQVDLFIAPSRAMKQACVSFGLPADKIINLCYPIKASENIETKADSANYILYFGRLSPEKGIEVLLSAMAGVDKRICLKIVGDGPDYKKLKNMIEKSGLSRRAQMLGAKFAGELTDLMTGALAIIVPSVWPENMPYSALESLALGKIVIASRIGGLSEIIQDGQNGFLFTSGDSDELAEKINLVAAKSNQEMESFGVNAKNSIIGITPENHYKVIRGLYEKILEINNISPKPAGIKGEKKY